MLSPRSQLGFFSGGALARAERFGSHFGEFSAVHAACCEIILKLQFNKILISIDSSAAGDFSS